MIPQFKRVCMLQTDKAIVLSSDVTYIDVTNIEDQRISIRVRGISDALDVTGFGALELVWCLKPSALEGKRLTWTKWAWVVHNVVAHPLMQLLAFMTLYKYAMWVHDVTIPKPTGTKNEAKAR